MTTTSTARRESSGPPPRPDHLVVVLLDSLNRHLLGAYGGTEFATPAIDAFAASEEINRGVRLHSGIFAKPRFCVTVDLANIELPSQLPGHLIPSRLKVLAVRAPRCIEFDEPGILRGGYQLLKRFCRQRN